MRNMGPLGHLTVVDLSGSVATAWCGKLFADFGARVVNLEGACGHPTRDDTATHALLSPHKHSVGVGWRNASEILARADLVLEAEAPGTVSASGLVPEGVLLVSLSWFGQTGPRAHAPANDQTLASELAWVHGIGPQEGPPLLPSGTPLQILAGATAFAAALGALTADAIGNPTPGRHIDVSIFEAAMCLTEVGPIAVHNGARPSPRLGTNRFVPTFPAGIYPTQRGFVGVTALTPPQWRALCDLVGRPEFGEEPRFQRAIKRMFAADEIDAWLGPAFLERSAEEWFHAGQARRIPLTIVPTTAELLESQQLRALDSFREICDPQLGVHRVPGAPFRLHGTPAHRDGPVAPLAEHPAPEAAPPEPAAEPPLPRIPLREPRRRPGLLRGLRILDLSMGWAGPLATRHLADLGAEVIKIESRRHFDWWRGWDASPKAIAERVIERAPGFNAENRNKLGITLDLSDPRGSELFKRLVAVSDAVIENYAADVMKKLGLDELALRACNPQLVTVSMPPFGAGGPWHAYRAYGSTVEQASGLPHLNGRADDPPTMTHVALGDPVAGVYAAGALLLGLLHQRRTGEGQRIDLSQVEALSTLGLHGLAEHITGKTPQRRGSRHASYAPQGVYPCAGEDRWLTLTVESDAQYGALCQVLDLPVAVSVAERRRAHDEIDARIAAWTRPRERDALVELLVTCGIPAGPVLDIAELLVHPQLAHRGFWQWLERDVVGRQPHPAAPYRFGPEPLALDSPAPTLGEHGVEVLRGLLGLSEDEIAAMETAR